MKQRPHTGKAVPKVGDKAFLQLEHGNRAVFSITRFDIDSVDVVLSSVIANDMHARTHIHTLALSIGKSVRIRRRDLRVNRSSAGDFQAIAWEISNPFVLAQLYI